MSEGKTRSFTMRLTPEDQTALAQLCERYGLDRPATLRLAIRQALARQAAPSFSGYFMPVGEPLPEGFPVHMMRKVVRE